MNVVSRDQGHFTIKVAPREALVVLGGATAALVAIPVLLGIVQLLTGHDHILGVVPMFDVTLETNVPAWFSGGQLLLASVLLLLIARNGQTVRPALLAGNPARQWYGLSLIFAYLSLDEITQLHERTTIPVRTALGTSGLLYYAWVIPALLMVLLVGLLYWRFLMRLPKPTRVRFVIAALLFAGGATGGDILGGLIYAMGYERPTERFLIWLVTLIEEGAEMTGIAFFIYSLLRHAARPEVAASDVAVHEDRELAGAT